MCYKLDSWTWWVSIGTLTNWANNLATAGPLLAARLFPFVILQSECFVTRCSTWLVDVTLTRIDCYLCKELHIFILAAQGEGNRSGPTEASFVWVVKATSHTNAVTWCEHAVLEAWLSHDTHSVSESMLAVCVHQQHCRKVLQITWKPSCVPNWRTHKKSRAAEMREPNYQLTACEKIQQTLAHNLVERTFGKKTQCSSDFRQENTNWLAPESQNM